MAQVIGHRPITGAFDIVRPFEGRVVMVGVGVRGDRDREQAKCECQAFHFVRSFFLSAACMAAQSGQSGGWVTMRTRLSTRRACECSQYSVRVTKGWLHVAHVSSAVRRS